MKKRTISKNFRSFLTHQAFWKSSSIYKTDTPNQYSRPTIAKLCFFNEAQGLAQLIFFFFFHLYYHFPSLILQKLWGFILSNEWRYLILSLLTWRVRAFSHPNNSLACLWKHHQSWRRAPIACMHSTMIKAPWQCSLQTSLCQQQHYKEETITHNI